MPNYSFITTFRLSFIVCWGSFAYGLSAGRPCSIRYWEEIWMTEKYFHVTSKNTYIDVILHTEFDFDNIFGRADLQMHHPKIK